MLSITEFMNEFIAESRGILDIDPDGPFEIETGSVTKAQRGELTGIRFLKQGSSLAPTLYIEDLYAYYADGHPVEEVACDAVATIKKSFSIDLPFSEDDMDISEMKDDMRPRLLSKERNRAIAKKVPHMDVGGGLMMIADVVRGDYRAMITKEILSGTGISEKELFKIALGNLSKDDAVLYELAEVVDAQTEGKADFLKNERTVKDMDEVFLLSNKDMFWGAAALFYPGVIDRLHELMGDFYVIPASVHELLVLSVSADFDPKNVIGVVRTANRSVVRGNDILSDDIYVCESDKLKRVAC